MDRSGVRFAGPLTSVEGKSARDYWCVIRDGKFLVYAFEDEKSKNDLLNLQQTPVESFSVGNLSASIVVLSPSSQYNISTSRALEINCALTRRKITFYAKHEWALDRWVEAVKLESASDDLLFDDSLQGTPLPPSVEWLLSSDANLDKEFLSDKGRISSPSASSTREVFLKKNEVHVAQGDTVMDSIVSHVPSSLLSSSRSTPAKTRSPLLTEKRLKERFMERAFPHIAANQTNLVASHPRNASSVIQSHTTSTFSSEKRQDVVHHLDSAGALDNGATKSDTTGARPSLSAVERMERSPREGATSAAARKIRRAKHAQIWKRSDDGSAGTTAEAPGPDGGSWSRANLFFYTGNNRAISRGSPSTEQALQSTNSKTNQRTRHTISVLPDCGTKTLSHNRKETSAAGSEDVKVIKPGRHSIAPITSLDMQINQRKRNSRSSQSESNQTSQPRMATIDDSRRLSSSSTESEQEPEQDLNDSFTRDSSPSMSLSSSDNFAGDERSDFFSESNSSLGEELRPVLRKLRTDVSQASTSPAPNRPRQKSAPQTEEARKKSGSFGSQILRRAKSAVGKRSKPTEMSVPGGSIALARQLSLTQTKSDGSSHAAADAEYSEASVLTSALTPRVARKRPEINSLVAMEGWLYRRRRMQWLRLWAVLSREKILLFYKNEQFVDDSSSKPLLVYDLRLGCQLTNVVQGKGTNTFELHVKLLPTDMNRGVNREGATNTSALGRESAGSVTTTTKRLQLMCKNVQDFVHWMKEFVMIATSQTTTDNCRATYPDVRIVHPIKRDEPEAVEVSKQQVHLDSRQSNQQDQPTHNCTSGTNDPSDNKRDFFKLDDTFWTGSDSISVGRLSQGTPRSDYPPDVIESPDRYEKSDASLRVSQASETLCEKFEATALACSATCVRAGENNPTLPGSLSELSGQQREFETTYKTFGYSNDFSYNDSAIGSSGTTSVLQTDRVVAPAALVSETSRPSLFGAIRSGGKSPERPAKSIRGTKEANFNTCEHKSTSQTGESHSFATDTVASSTTTDSLRTIEKPCGTTARYDVQGATSNKSTSAGYCDVKSGSIAAVSERKMNATLGAAFIRQATDIGKEKDTRSYQSDNASWQNASEADKMRSRAASTLLGESFAVKSQPPLHATRPVSKEAKRDGRSGECESSLCGRSSVTVELKFGDRLSSPPPSVQKQSQPEAQPAVDRGREEGFADCVISVNASVFQEKYSGLLLLRRCLSDGNILEACCDKPCRMRTFKRPVPELTRIDFIEIYGLPPRKASNGHDGKILACLGSLDADKYLLPCPAYHPIETPASRPSSNEFSCSSSTTTSSGSATNESQNHESSNRRPKSVSNEAAIGNGNRTLKLSSIARSAFRKSFSRDDGPGRKTKATVCQVPASQLINASHRGHLDRRNKKKQWERFFCVLQDSCLYFYNTPHSDATQDAVLLRGYDVIADVTNMNRSRFTFRLVQRDSPTLYFSTENHEDFLLWVGSMEKDTRCVVASESCVRPADDREASPVHSDKSNKSEKSSETKPDGNSEQRPGNKSGGVLTEKELVEIEKHKLLREIATQQQQILEEERELNRKVLGARQLSLDTSRSPRRDHVINKYDRVRAEEELKLARLMAHLNRRRNSAQLKVDQLARDIAPRSGKKRRQDHQQFAAIETKLNEMKSHLETIDRQILEQQARKQSVMDKLLERQELELLISEQRESLAIMRRLDNDAVRRGKHRNRSCDALTSIEEMSNTSDGNSSGSLNSPQSQRSDHLTTSNPMPSPDCTCGVVSSGASLDSLNSDSFAELRNISGETRTTSLMQCSSVSSVEDALATSSLSSSLTSISVFKDLQEKPKRFQEEVDPALLAEIEQFEEFSKMALQKRRSKSPSFS